MRKTKIICTLGPASEREDVLRKLMIEGMDVARFNFSHGTHEEQLEKLNRVKQFRFSLKIIKEVVAVVTAAVVITMITPKSL